MLSLTSPLSRLTLPGSQLKLPEAEIPEVGTFGKSIAVTLPADKANLMNRYDFTKLWLKGLTLVR